MQMSKQVIRIANNLHSLNSSPKTKTREFKDAGQGNNVPTGPKSYGCQGFGHMKQECPPYVKSIGKSKSLAATLSDTEPKANFDESDQDGIVSAFTSTVESSKEVVDLIDEEDVHTTYAKLYRVSEKHEKLYQLATRKLNEVELEREELSTKVDEAN